MSSDRSAKPGAATRPGQTEDRPLVVLAPDARARGMVETLFGPGALRSGKIRLVVDPDDMPTAATDGAGEDAPALLLIYRDLQGGLVSGMRAGQPPRAALLDWLEVTQPLIAQARAHRAGTLVVDMRALNDAPKEVLRHIRDRFGMTLRASRAKSRNPDKPVPDDPVLEVLASAMIQSAPTARRLQGELEAAMPAELCPPVLPADHLGMAFSTLKTIRAQRDGALEAASQAEAGLKAQEAEIAQLREASAGLETRLEAARAETTALAEQSERDRQAASAEIEDLRYQLAQAQDNADRQSQRLHQETDAHAKVQMRLGVVERERDIARRDLQLREAHIQELQEAVGAQTAEIDSLRNSTSWRVTRPLRGMRRMVSPGSEQAED